MPGEWIQWTVNECEKSPIYQAEIDHLRAMAAKGLNGRPLTDSSLKELDEAVSAICRLPRSERRGAWSEDHDPVSDCSLDHVQRYLRKVRKVARERFHGVAALDNLVHELVGRSGYTLRLEDELVADFHHPAPVGPVASMLAAYRQDKRSFGAGVTAMREMDRRHRPRGAGAAPAPWRAKL